MSKEPTTAEIRERHNRQDRYKGWSPCSDCHTDRGILLEHVDELEADAVRLRQDRYDALSVYSTDGLLSSEWVARSGKAEREVKELEAKLAKLEPYIKHDAYCIDFLSATGECTCGLQEILEAANQ